MSDLLPVVVCLHQYFVILPASAYDELNAPNITDIIAYYLDKAPLSAYRNQSDNAAMWDRHHIRRSDKPNPDYYWQEPQGQQQQQPHTHTHTLAWSGVNCSPMCFSCLLLLVCWIVDCRHARV